MQFIHKTPIFPNLGQLVAKFTLTAKPAASEVDYPGKYPLLWLLTSDDGRFPTKDDDDVEIANLGDVMDTELMGTLTVQIAADWA